MKLSRLFKTLALTTAFSSSLQATCVLFLPSIAALTIDNKPALAAYCTTSDNQTIQQTYQETMGRYPRTDELEYWCNYFRSRNSNARRDWMIPAHREWLSSSQGYVDAVATIIRSYQAVFSRDPHPHELQHWIDAVQNPAKRSIYSEMVTRHAHGHQNKVIVVTFIGILPSATTFISQI